MRSRDEIEIHKKLITAVKLNEPTADDALLSYLHFTVLKTFTRTLERFGIESDGILTEVFSRTRDRIQGQNFDADEAGLLAWVLSLARSLAIERFRESRKQDDPNNEQAVAEFEKALGESDFTLSFSATLSQEQVNRTLEAVADYYRSCGGVGFEIDFEAIENEKVKYVV